MEMSRMTKVDWSLKQHNRDFTPAIARYIRYLRDIGLRESTIESYVFRVKQFLEYTQNDKPATEKIGDYRSNLIENNLSRSSVNNTCFAIKHFYKMIGEDVSFPFIRPDNHIPYYFDEDDVTKIFDSCHNLKHLAMLKTLFFATLRASELCDLDDHDIDLKTLTVRVHGKGGKDGFAFINNDCALVLKDYFEVRPPLEIDGRQPLFYTDFGHRWDRKDIHKMFTSYKERAGIIKQGGAHVFARHTPATLMIANGADISIVQKLLRHNDIRTTLRYAHVAEKTLREKYDRCLTLGV